MYIIAERAYRLEHVVGIFNMDTSTISKVTRDFLAERQRAGKVSGTQVLPRSFILVCLPGASAEVAMTSRTGAAAGRPAGGLRRIDNL